MNNDNKAVRAITGVTCVMLLAKLLAVVRSILQARVFGVGPDVDLFTQANNYTVSLFTTVAYALCVAAIPIFSHRLLKSRESCFDAADRLISTTVLCALGVDVVMLALDLTGVAEKLAGVSGDAALFRYCFGVLLLSLPIITLTYLLLALFQSMEHYTLQGSLSLLYSVALCGALAVFGPTMSLRSFTLLTSVGWLLQLAMVIPSILREKYRFHFRPDFRLPELRLFVRTGAATVFNSALFLLCYLLNTRFAAAASAGTISAFYYADKIYEPLTTTLIYSISIVMFPKFSQKYEQLPAKEYYTYVVHVLKNTLLLVLPISLLFASFGTPVIRVLFEGGSFSASDSALTGSIFSMYAFGMAGFFMLDLLNKAYYAMQRTLTPMVITACVLALTTGLNALCRWLWPDATMLLAAGTALAFLLGGTVMYVRFARAQGVSMPKKQLFWGVLWSLLMGAGVRFVYLRFIAGTAGKLMLMVKCGALGVAGMLIYLILMGPMVPTHEILTKFWGKKQ